MKALIVGLRRSGLGAAKLLTRMCYEVTVTDMKNGDELGSVLDELPASVNLLLGGHPRWAFTETDLIVMSPGVPMDIMPVIAAKAAGVKVIGELELSYRCLKSVPFYAITGTNGKSTTVTLLDRMFKAAGMRSLLGGNIGNALTEEVMRLTGGDPKKSPEIDCVVAELSSFQLEAIDEFHAKGSAVLNVTPDHLDRYHEMEPYIQAKAEITRNQTEEDFIVLNADDRGAMQILNMMRGAPRQYFFSRHAAVKGVFVQDGVLMSTIDDTMSIIAASEIAIKGVHNLENAMAASLMALLAGVPVEAVAATLREFQGLPHRSEFVCELDGVRYINDSKGTNVAASVKSIESFAEPIVLIAGGRDKEGDFDVLADSSRGRVKAVVLIGEAGGKIGMAFDGVAKCFDASDFRDAVQKARTIAKPGDVVLLSPACASFDMFRDFEDRGDKFKKLVMEL